MSAPRRESAGGPVSTKSLAEFLFALRSKGVRVWADNERLRYQAPKGGLNSKDLETLRAWRDSLLTFLGQPSFPEREARLTPRISSDAVPLTFSQQFWCDVLNVTKRPSMRSIAAAVRLRGPLDIEALRQGVATLVRRHEALRTRIAFVEGGARQQIDEISDCGLEILDLTALKPDEREIQARHFAEQIVQEPVFLHVGPLFAARLLKLDCFDHVLVVATEHVISDIASIGIVLREILALYAQSTQGKPHSLPEIPIQFPDYAVWQRKSHNSWMQKHGSYWQQRLDGAGRVRLSAGEEAPRASGMSWANLPVRFEQSLRNDLLETSRRERTSLVMSVLTTFAALILRWCNTTSLVLPFTTAGRFYPELENTIGFFGTPLFLRVDLLENDTFVDVLRRVTQEYATAYTHDDSCRMAVQMCRPEFTLNPPFNWIPQDFDMNAGISDHELQTEHSLIITEYKLEITSRDDEEWDGEPRIDLLDSKNAVTGAIGYRADRFTLSTIERFRQNLLLFAEKLATEPKTPVKAVTLQSA